LRDFPQVKSRENRDQASLQLSLWSDIPSLLNPKRRQFDLLERRQVLFSLNLGLNGVKNGKIINNLLGCSKYWACGEKNGGGTKINAKS
jgi:hypothetical protein